MVTGLLLALVWPLQGILFALGAPIAAVVVSALGTGFGFSLFAIWWETALVRHVPAHALSKSSNAAMPSAVARGLSGST